MERVLIDTALESLLGQPGTAGFAWADRYVHEVGPLEVSAITIFERTRGLMQAIHRAQQKGDESRAEDWHERLKLYTDLWQSPTYRVHPLTGEIAQIAAAILAVQPIPPPALYQWAKRRRGKRKQRRPEIRAAWERDVWIAATAVSVGLPVATPNVEDFRAVAQLLSPPWLLVVLGYPGDLQF